MMKSKLLTSILIIFCALCLTACKDLNEEIKLGNPVDYAGVYYSGAIDGIHEQALFLYQDGTYKRYSVPIDETPEMTESGYFQVLEEDGQIDLGYLNDENNFVRDTYFYLSSEGLIMTGLELIKLPEAVTPEELTTMAVPFDLYIGEWENDSRFAWITITEDQYNIIAPPFYSAGNITKLSDCLLVGVDKTKLSVTEDGGIKLEYMEGIFYPKGDERLENAQHKAFIGNWYNEISGDAISFSEDGRFTIISEGGNDDYELEIIGGTPEVNKNILTYMHRDTERTAEINDGVVRISGIDGVFEKK